MVCKRIIILTDPSTPLNDAHHGRTFFAKVGCLWKIMRQRV